MKTGDFDVEVGWINYTCETRADRAEVLRVLSQALAGESAGTMRTGNRSFYAKQEGNGDITVTTQSSRRRFDSKTVAKALEYYLRR